MITGAVHKCIVAYVILMGVLIVPVMGYEAMYEQTAVGTIHIKQVPQRTALETVNTNPATLDNTDGQFGTLFRYISQNNIAMTVPVEIDANPVRMRFMLGTEYRAEQFASTESVVVKTLPAQTVASIGIIGAYSDANYTKHYDMLIAWLEQQPSYEVNGDPYAVYWNGPLVPWFMKRSEIHIPVRAVRQQ